MKKTSKTHPLIINAVNVPMTTGMIGMTLCPGKVQKSALSGDWARDLDSDLRSIQEWGASILVTLMEPHELEAFKVVDLPDRVPDGITHLILPIVDGGVPDQPWEQAWDRLGPQVRSTLREGNKIVVHCRGGLGRTGLVTARLLVEFGMDPELAIKAVRKARPGAIENAVQEKYVRKQTVDPSLPKRPYHRITPDRASRFRGCLLGGAVGDALGAPVEFMDLSAIRGKFGPNGIRDFVPAYGRLGAITDDTQMTLFTAEGLIRTHVRLCLRGITTLPGVVAHAYQRWLITQGMQGKAKEVGTDGWLFSHEELFSTRAPGNTCVAALKARETLGEADAVKNDSKGCGGIMRVAPVGLFATLGENNGNMAFQWGCEVAALTHGHPTGQLSAGVMSFLVYELVQGASLRDALSKSEAILKRNPGHEETLGAIQTAMGLASRKGNHDEALARLGQGWGAEEALGIALYCALTAENFEQGVIRAVNIAGDSDSTGSITGNLLGAMLGVHEIPERWLRPLELKECLVEVADDLATLNEWPLAEYGHDTPEQKAEQDYWWGRYPGW